MFNNINLWISAARPRTLPLAVTCVLIGGSLAKAHGLNDAGTARFTPVVFGALVTVVLLQVLANFANDYGDFTKGTDAAAGRTDRALASGQLTPQSMKRAIVFCAICAFVVGMLTLASAFVPSLLPGTQDGTLRVAQMGLLGLLGVASIGAAMKYTLGKRSYGYQGLGDIYVMLFFGFVGVLGVGLLVSHQISLSWMLPAFFSGCMSVAVLNLNNLRDHVSDAASGKRTMVVKIGFLGGKRYHLALLGLGWGGLLLFFQGPWEIGAWRGTMWYALIALLHARHAADVWRCEDPASLDPELKRIALSTFLVALFMFMDQTLRT